MIKNNKYLPPLFKNRLKYINIEMEPAKFRLFNFMMMTTLIAYFYRDFTSSWNDTLTLNRIFWDCLFASVDYIETKN